MSGASAATRRYMNRTRSPRRKRYSSTIGSLTLTRKSLPNEQGAGRPIGVVAIAGTFAGAGLHEYMMDIGRRARALPPVSVRRAARRA
jgi:hypothetical protein